MTDSEIISHYGGPTHFARILGLTSPGSVQRVSNWGVRGIPADIKLQHPNLFGISIGAIPPSEVHGVNPQAQGQGSEC
ncbi:MAG: hypothetical protein ACOYB1_09860 [Limnohabitans sp.]